MAVDSRILAATARSLAVVVVHTFAVVVAARSLAVVAVHSLGMTAQDIDLSAAAQRRELGDKFGYDSLIGQDWVPNRSSVVGDPHL